MSLKKLLFENKKKAVLYALGILLSSTTNIIFTFAMSNAFSVLEADNSEQIFHVFLISAFLMILPAFVHLASRMMRIGFMSDVLRKVRKLAYEKIMNQDIETHSKVEKQSHQSALISDVNLFENDFFLSIMNLGFSFFSSIFSFFILLHYSWIIALVSLSTSILQLLIAKGFEKRVREARKRTQESNKTFTNMTSNLISGFRTIKGFMSERRFDKKFSTEIVNLENVKAEYFQLNKSQEVLSEGLATLATILNFFIACYLMYLGQINVVDIIVVINLSTSLIWIMIAAISFVNRLKASVDVYHSLVDTDEVDEEVKSSFDNGVLQVDDLSYAYGDNQVIDKMSFNLEKNMKLLIHGPSGTGKTTLLNCISQNLSDYEGTIRYGTQKLNEIDHRAFLNKTSYVRQSHFMFEDSIKHNIIMNEVFDEEKFEDVLRSAGLEEWISELEVGADHLLEQNGSNISGGQRQRVSIARELYSGSEILFIDEPSSSLDDETADRIYQTILSLDKTVVCVSHRHLDYLKDKFDRVISFEEVRV